jgi:hypothetical protein
MDPGSRTPLEPQPIDAVDGSVLQLLSSLTLTLFTDLGPKQLSRLLDAIAENEFFHELTMLD